MKIGLTGGIASGKSTVAAMFADLGISVIDTDVIARELVEPGQPALAAIVEQFGEGVLDSSGALDRQRMRELVFTEEPQRQKLEAILHPRIVETMLARVSAAAGPYQVLVIPLLLETGMDSLVDRVLLVDCSPQLQLQRLLARDQGDESTAQQILAAQMDRKARLTAVHDIVVNDAGTDRLREAVVQLHHTYCALAS